MAKITLITLVSAQRIHQRKVKINLSSKTDLTQKETQIEKREKPKSVNISNYSLIS